MVYAKAIDDVPKEMVPGALLSQRPISTSDCLAVPAQRHYTSRRFPATYALRSACCGHTTVLRGMRPNCHLV